ncbi:HAMP domain-containing sensor histidine kinase [Corynebacterium sp. Q4381]|uniref:sensor histidine kinase n=1 Tax=Corynebacterium sp. Marseille-Q4381 TaxID=3121597 RepID=UPI002FE69102
MRLSLRARVTVMFVLTVLGVGILLIGLVYAYLRLTPVPFQAEFSGADGAVIDAAIPVTEEILRTVVTISLAVLAVLTALAGAVGWFVAGRVLAPLRSIAGDARAVTSGDTATRVAYSGPADEVGDLANALNSMLDSLAASLAAHQRFAANASHELKTPIATIQALADVALSDADATEGELRESLQRVREVNAGNAATVAALLTLARVQSGHDLQRESVDLSEICRRVARANGIERADVADGVAVEGDAELLATAVDNLARNAVTHGEPGTSALTLAHAAGRTRVEVASSGEVVSVEDAARMAEPFAGSRSSRGHGLGLPLVAAIATAHGGGLEIQPLPGGGISAVISL